MFSKALFKQSMKAHWVKWVAVTLSTCIMLAIVIIVLGNLGINDIRDSLKNVFVQADAESSLKENSVDSYELYLDSMDMYNTVQPYAPLMGYLTGMYDEEIAKVENPDQAKKEEIATTIAENMSSSFPSSETIDKETMKMFLVKLMLVHDAKPELAGLDLIEEAYYSLVYEQAYNLAIAKEGTTEEDAIAQATGARYIASKAIGQYKGDKADAETNEQVYEYKRANYTIIARDEVNIFMAENAYNSMKDEIGEEEAKQQAVVVKVLSNTAITTYELWINEYKTANPDAPITAEQEQEARSLACQSISDQIPEKVAEALTELGDMDMYGLIIGSIFYRIAGLLLPMVFVIITANGLLAGQVDSGSMAYVLSTPTKRRAVTVTQMTYLITALFAMFALLTVVSVVAVAVVGGNSFAINYGEILLFNLGAFLTMFAFAGFCFMCSAIFNRTKHSLGIGGGLTIFSLVCTILGLFGSSVVPSAMRISAMNFFNYLSIITFFDTVSILSGSLSYLWKFGVLLAIGVVTFIIGIFRFDKKDLPL